MALATPLLRPRQCMRLILFVTIPLCLTIEGAGAAAALGLGFVGVKTPLNASSDQRITSTSTTRRQHTFPLTTSGSAQHRCLPHRQQQQQQQQQQQLAPRPLLLVTASTERSVGTGGGRRTSLPIWSATSTGGDEIVSDTARIAQEVLHDEEAAAAAAAGESKSPRLGAYWKILRPQNIPSSFGLVSAGALVSSHTTDALLAPKVLLTAFAAASVSVGSCVLNDWFDIELDRVNEPERPLVTGEVVPVHALWIGVGFLLAAVASASAVDPAALQATIVSSVALTLAYTPLLKPIPLVKNFVVAMVIAAAIASGGLAAGAGVADTLTPSVLTFFVIAHREILMDITDVEGDRAGGVRTLPVLMGRDSALAFAAALLTVGVATAVVGVAEGTTDASRAAAVSLSLLFFLPLYVNLFQVSRSSYSHERLSSAVNQALGPLALVLGLMGTVLQ